MRGFHSPQNILPPKSIILACATLYRDRRIFLRHTASLTQQQQATSAWDNTSLNLCDVLTKSLAFTALCAIFFHKKIQLNLFSLGQIFLSYSRQCSGSLLTVRQFFCTSICYIPVTYYLGTAHPVTSFFSARKHSYRCSLSDSQLEISLPLRKIDKRQKQGKRTISVNKRLCIRLQLKQQTITNFRYIRINNKNSDNLFSLNQVHTLSKRGLQQYYRR